MAFYRREAEINMKWKICTISCILIFFIGMLNVHALKGMLQ